MTLDDSSRRPNPWRLPNQLRLFRRFRVLLPLGHLRRFRLPKQFSPALCGLTLRVLDVEDVPNVAAPSLCQRMDDGFFGDVQGQFAAPRPDDVLAKLDFVSSEYLDAFATPGNGHIPLLVVGCGPHGGIGEQHIVHCLALGGVGGDRIAAHELAAGLVQSPTVCEDNAAIRVNLFDRDQFAIDHLPTVCGVRIGLQLQPVAAGQGQFLGLQNRKPIKVFEGNRANALVGLNQ
jgi:hypothetical protein